MYSDYQRGRNARHDLEVDALMEAFDAGSLRLRIVIGARRMIASARSVDLLEDDSMGQVGDMLWSLADAGYETDEAIERRELQGRN